MKLFVTLLFLLAYTNNTFAQDCDKDTLYIIDSKESLLTPLPENCSEEIYLALPVKDEDELNIFTVNAAAESVIHFTKKDALDAKFFAKNGCIFGGNVELGDKVWIYGGVNFDKRLTLFEISHTQIFSLYKFNIKKAELSPIISQFYFSNINKLHSDSPLFQPSNVGVKIKFPEKKHFSSIIQFSAGPNINPIYHDVSFGFNFKFLIKL